MKTLKVIVFVSALTIFASLCFAEGSKTNEKTEIKKVLFNYQILNMSRDSSVFLHTLEQLKNNNKAEVENFLEYQIDEIVCASSELMSEMNPYQKKLAAEFLQKIKKYRVENPRNQSLKIDPTIFSNYFEPYNDTYAQRADEILENVK